jgi:hypothetical protein
MEERNRRRREFDTEELGNFATSRSAMVASFISI